MLGNLTCFNNKLASCKIHSESFFCHVFSHFSRFQCFSFLSKNQFAFSKVNSFLYRTALCPLYYIFEDKKSFVRAIYNGFRHSGATKENAHFPMKFLTSLIKQIVKNNHSLHTKKATVRCFLVKVYFYFKYLNTFSHCIS